MNAQRLLALASELSDLRALRDALWKAPGGGRLRLMCGNFERAAFPDSESTCRALAAALAEPIAALEAEIREETAPRVTVRNLERA